MEQAVEQAVHGIGSETGSAWNRQMKRSEQTHCAQIGTKPCLFNVRKAALFPRKLATQFIFFSFLFHFMLDTDPNPAPESEPEPQYIPAPVALRQKVTVPAVPVPQH